MSLKSGGESVGFTIVELIIVVAVIAILATITILTYNGTQKSARDTSRDVTARAVIDGLELYWAKNGQYPNACGVLNTGCSITTLAATLVPNYMDKIPNDPGPGVTVSYVVGGTPTLWGKNYGIHIKYESKTACKYLKGLDPPTGWWPSAPECNLN